MGGQDSVKVLIWLTVSLWKTVLRGAMAFSSDDDSTVFSLRINTSVTVMREWRMAKAWLYDVLNNEA